LTGLDLAPRPLPVAVGQAARTLALPAPQVLALYLHAFAANLVSAAVRFVPLGQTEGQRVLAALHPLIDALALKAATATLDDLATSALRADLAAMQHETMDVRIFRT
ncbi:urease accessory protein UreF, partial [Cereibacter changlensis]